MERVNPGTAGEGRPAGWRDEPVYLDYNATTPVDARVAGGAAILGPVVRQPVQQPRLGRAAPAGGGPGT